MTPQEVTGTNEPERECNRSDVTGDGATRSVNGSYLLDISKPGLLLCILFPFDNRLLLCTFNRMVGLVRQYFIHKEKLRLHGFLDVFWLGVQSLARSYSKPQLFSQKQNH